MSRMMAALAELGRQYLDRPSRLPPVEASKRLCDDLLSDHGEASGTALASEVIQLYEAMDADDRIAFIEMLDRDYAIDRDAIRDAANAWLTEQNADSYLTLARAVQSPRLELLGRLNMAPGGTTAIVDMRARLLRLLRERPELRVLDAEFRHLFTAWFNRGFLQFERIDWHTPAVVLEKLIAYEAVHEIHGWDDLRRRLAADRRCFAFFHPTLPDEPLIFVEVALTHGIAERIQPLLDLTNSVDTDSPPDTAIFYSISNCQTGLAGISFGNFLIKQVVDALNDELPGIKTFATLSPIPGFRRWLEATVSRGPSELIAEAEQALLVEPGWAEDADRRGALKKLLMRLCAEYLVRASAEGRPIDPVARFHLGNGASVARINWEGDPSEKGVRQSAGLMVNYRYDPDEIVANHEAYVKDGTVAVSSQVRALLPRRRSG
jgi:malonyl-CoA decarboxylase